MPYRLTGTSASERLVGRNDPNDFDFIRGSAAMTRSSALAAATYWMAAPAMTGLSTLIGLVDIDVGESVIGGDGFDTIVFTGSKNLGNLFSMESIEALEFRGSSTAFNQLTMLGSQYGNGFPPTAEL